MIKQSQAKTKRFLKAINEAAMQKCNDISKQIEQTTAASLRRAEEDASRDGHLKIEAAKSKIEAHAKMEVAVYEKQKKREIYAKRTAYQTAVFEESAAKLKAFVGSKEYIIYLKDNLSQIKQQIGKNPSVFISSEDKAARETVLQLFPDAFIITDDSIKIGGLKIKDSALNLMIDATLDAKLEAQHEWFISHSDLKINI